MPSGHAQASTVWILACAYLQKKYFWIIAILLALLIGLSRAFLGVHFPSQVITGWLIGIVLVVCFIRFEKGVTLWFQRLKLYNQLLIVAGLAALITVTGAVFLQLTGHWEMPADWIRNASPYLSIDLTKLRSYSMASVSGNAGSFLGIATGAILMGRARSFQAGGKWWIRLLRILLGLTCILLLYLGLQALKPDLDREFMFSAWRFGGFLIVSFSAVYLLPVLFIRIKLVQSDQ
jgi:hypothetical protein